VELQHGRALPEDTLDAIVRAWCTRQSAIPGPFGLQRDDVEALLEPLVDEIASFLASSIRRLPDGIATEVIESGVCITGGGARLGRLVSRIEQRTGLTITQPADPMTSVIRGAAAMLRNERLLREPVATAL
jgi:rod shape-determining protein MreB